MSATELRTVPFARPWITEQEREAVLEVLAGPVLTHGPQGKLFEEDFAGFLGPGAICVSVSSCMAALHLSCLALGVGPGDEVVVPAQTHAAMAHAVELVGARPVFADCDPRTGNVTADTLDRALSPRTRAISIVHFVGIPCEMGPILEIAERRGLSVIEDCAIALGARLDGTHVGLFGDVGCFSFYPAKHITTGEGGMLVSRHPELAAAARKLRAFGVDRSYAERVIPGMYDVPALGMNYRLSELQAALGRVQLARLEENLARRAANFRALKHGLERIGGVRVVDSVRPGATKAYYCLSVVLEDQMAASRDAVVQMLNAGGVGTSIYYPQPVPRMTYYRRKYKYDPAVFPHAEEISDSSIALPVGPHVDADDTSHIVALFANALQEVRR